MSVADADIDPASLIKGGRISAADLGAVIPANTPNTWNPDAPANGGYQGDGFKYQWTGASGDSYTVWGHGANPNAHAIDPSSNSAQGPTVRIKIGNRYVAQAPVNGQPTVRNANRYANETHIALDD